MSKSKWRSHPMPGALLKAEMFKKRTTLRREAQFEVKMHKAAHPGALLEVEMFKTHTVVARSTVWSQNAQGSPSRSTFGSWDVQHRCGTKHSSKSKRTSPPFSEPFWKLRCSKSARRCGAKRMSKSRCTKHTIPGALLEVEMFKKRTLLWREARFEIKMYKAHHAWSFHVASARDFAPRQKYAKQEGSPPISKMLARVGHLKTLKRICKDVFRVAGTVPETCSSEILRGPGADFLRRVKFWIILGHQIFRFAKMILWISAALRMTWLHFSWQSQYFNQLEGKKSPNALEQAVSSELTFDSWRKSPRIASVLMLSTSEVAWSLAKLLCFWYFQVRNLSKSRRIASFSSLQVDRYIYI